MERNSTNSCVQSVESLSTDAAVNDVYITLTAIMAVLSICGAILIIRAVYSVPGLKTRSKMLLVYLSCSDLVLAAGNLSSVIW